MSLLHDTHTSEAPEAFLDQQGTVFTRFGIDTQDSGNISYGVQVDDRRFFVKTAGAPSDAAFLNHEQRVYWLNNARTLASTLQDPILPRLFNAVESPHGPMLVCEWVSGELIRTPIERRADPRSPFQRFRHLPLNALVGALDHVFRIHVALAERG